MRVCHLIPIYLVIASRVVTRSKIARRLDILLDIPLPKRRFEHIEAKSCLKPKLDSSKL